MFKYIVSVFLILFSFTFFHAQNELTDDLYDAYYVLAGNSGYYKKLDSVEYLLEEYKETENKQIISLIIQLLEFQYERKDFKEDDDKMYYNDVIAEKLINILEYSQSPYAFEVLLDVVIHQNHRWDTVLAAWDAIDDIDWSQKTNAP